MAKKKTTARTGKARPGRNVQGGNQLASNANYRLISDATTRPWNASEALHAEVERATEKLRQQASELREIISETGVPGQRISVTLRRALHNVADQIESHGKGLAERLVDAQQSRD